MTDKKAKAKFLAAKTDLEREKVMEANLAETISQMDAEHRQAHAQIGELCVAYSQLAISGSFAGYLVSLINVLEMRYEARKAEAAPLDELEDSLASIKELKAKYDLVSATVRDSIRRRRRKIKPRKIKPSAHSGSGQPGTSVGAVTREVKKALRWLTS